jgi:5''-3'' exonuclease
MRYYSEKFKVTGAEVEEFRGRIHQSYMEGISWVFEYYFQGCSS